MRCEIPILTQVHIVFSCLHGVVQVLEVRPELASYTFFNHQYNVMHHAAGTFLLLCNESFHSICTCWCSHGVCSCWCLLLSVNLGQLRDSLPIVADRITRWSAVRVTIC